MTLTLVTTLVALLAIAGIVSFVARRIGVPYPVLLIVVGLILALIPHLPPLRIDSDLILFVFLPPLVYRGAFHAPIRELIATRRAILIFAIPGVLVTGLLVALPVHYLAGLSWGAAFVLGAIVAPTDPIAALAIFRTLGAPPRLAAIVEGESLLNDGTGLVLYRIVIAAVVSGGFSLSHAILDFVLVAGGGVVVGLAVGWLAFLLLRIIHDPEAEATLHIAIAFGSYILAERLEVSGVLATVTAGVILGSRFVQYSRATTRLVGIASWDVLEFVANSLLFLIVGLQLRAILGMLADTAPIQIVGIAAVTVLAVVAARFAMTFGANALVRSAGRVRILRTAPLSSPWITVLAMSGLRGGLTLALTLALPLTTDAGAPFPRRDLLQFLTFVIVVVTLVPFSLVLPVLMRRLRLTGDRQQASEEATARRHAAQAARNALARIDDGDLDAESRQRLDAYYDVQIHHYDDLLAREGRVSIESDRWRAIQLRLLDAERDAVVDLVRTRQISTAAAEQVQRSIDLDAVRLMADGGETRM